MPGKESPGRHRAPRAGRKRRDRGHCFGLYALVIGVGGALSNRDWRGRGRSFGLYALVIGLGGTLPSGIVVLLLWTSIQGSPWEGRMTLPLPVRPPLMPKEAPPPSTEEPSPQKDEVPPTRPTPRRNPGHTVDAHSIIQAEDGVAQSGVTFRYTSDTGGGQHATRIGDGDQLRFDRVDFGAKSKRVLRARVASGAPRGVSGMVRVRLDSPTAKPVGDFSIDRTGGWQAWRTVPANLTSIGGVHTVYLTFESDHPADFVNLNWIRFDKR
ncbi:carbohydrate-binding protein [Actinomadura sp. 3N407]|uniref:carbohydrate-binding protein n=1 Tax=Actinomadura sp. 3N407 TaxID=3457423 RepID=UPI003FCEA076